MERVWWFKMSKLHLMFWIWRNILLQTHETETQSNIIIKIFWLLFLVISLLISKECFPCYCCSLTNGALTIWRPNRLTEKFQGVFPSLLLFIYFKKILVSGHIWGSGGLFIGMIPNTGCQWNTRRVNFRLGFAPFHMWVLVLLKYSDAAPIKKNA